MDMNLGEHYSVPLWSAFYPPKFTFIPRVQYIHPNPTSLKVLTHSSTNSKSKYQLKKLGQKSHISSSKSGISETLDMVHLEAKFLSIRAPVKLNARYLLPKCNGGTGIKWTFSQGKSERNKRVTGGDSTLRIHGRTLPSVLLNSLC